MVTFWVIYIIVTLVVLYTAPKVLDGRGEVDWKYELWHICMMLWVMMTAILILLYFVFPARH